MVYAVIKTSRYQSHNHCKGLITGLSLILFTLLLSFHCLTTVYAENQNDIVTVYVGGKSVPFVVKPFLADDGQVYAPVDIVHLMGASYVPDTNGRSVTITSASGKQAVAEFKFIQSRYCIPIMRYAGMLGAAYTWDKKNRSLSFKAKLDTVMLENGVLTISTTYPVYFHVNTITGPYRIYIDLYGVDLSSPPASLPVREPYFTSIRTGRVQNNNVRVTVELKRAFPYRIESPVSTNKLQVAIAVPSNGRNNPIAAQPTPKPPVVTTKPPVVVQKPPMTVTPPVNNNNNNVVPPLAVKPPVVSDNNATQSARTQNASGPNIKDISFKVISPTLTEVDIKVSEATKYRWMTLDDPNRLAVDFLDTGVDPDLQSSLDVSTAVVKSVRNGLVKSGAANFGRVVIDLKKAVDFNISTENVDDGIIYIVNIQSPSSIETNPNGALRGKIVMVDPGHGADDVGAIGIGGIREKDLNLAIARKLRESLAKNGATVYMTREDDVKPSVNARPQMAIAAKADYFISIHCDESGGRNSHSGSTVYFHAHNATCKRMAECILNRVSAVSTIPSIGTKSDTIRFRTGFGVLRGSPMPAVLVECGYMNNEKDLAKLQNEEVQKHIADGIVAGLLDFIAERSSR